MLRTTGKKAAVLLCALLAGALVLHLGLRVTSSKPGDGRAISAEKAQPAAENDQHEAMVLTDVLKKKPEHTPVLLRLAQLAEQAGKQPEAVAHLRKVLANEPENSDARLELGRVSFQMGDVQSAIEQTRIILDRKPDHAEALFNMGAIYANLGDAALARQYWNRLLRTGPHTEVAQRAQNMLTQLPPETSEGTKVVSRLLKNTTTARQ